MNQENKLNKAEKIVDEVIYNFSSIGKIGSHTNNDGSITIMLSNEEVEFKNDDFEYNIEMILFQLDGRLRDGVIFSHEYIIDEDDEEDMPNMCNINLKVIGE